MKIRNVLILLLLSLCILPVSAESDMTLLMLEGLYEMPIELLREKGTFLAVSTEGTREELLARIFSYYGYDEVSEVSVEKKLEGEIILNGARYYYMNESQQTIILSGNVRLEGDGWSLSSDIIFFDTSKRVVSAVGQVHFIQNTTDVSAEVLTFYIDTQDVIVQRGSTQLERESADDDPLILFSEGEAMRITSDPGTYHASDTSITSSIDHSYYSIDASDAFFVTGNDVFITDATLKMGRVPVLYLPFFYYPGKTLTFNPLFGYDSNKGSFVTLTYEVYGDHPLKGKVSEEDEGTFTTFFSDDRELSRTKGSVTYEYVSLEEETPFQRWVRENNSYLTLFGDAYENEGIHAGIDSYHSYDGGKLVADLSGGLAWLPSSSVAAGIPDLRYYMEPEITVKLSSLDASLKFPVYSDEQVKEDYIINERFGNFFNSFFSDETTSLSGGNRISSYDWEAKGSFTLKPGFLGTFVEEVKVSSLRSSIRFIRSYDTTQGGFIIDTEHPLSYQASMKGELFSFSSQASKQADAHQSTYAHPQEQVEELARFNLTPLESLKSPEQKENRTLSTSLKYTTSQGGDYETEYVKGIRDDENSRMTNKTTFTLSESYLPDVFRGTHTLVSDYSDTAEAAERSQQYALLYSHTLSIPYISLTHTYKQKLYNWERFTATDGTVDEEEEGASWDDTSVQTHTLSLAPRFTFSSVSITPSLTYRLPPFEGLLTTSLKVQKGKLSLSSSLSFEEDAGEYSFSNTRFTAAYSGKNFKTSHTLNTVPDGMDIMNSYTVSSNVSFSFDVLDTVLKADTLYDGDLNELEKANGELSTRFAGARISYERTDTGFEPTNARFSISTDSFGFSFWHERITAEILLSGEYYHLFYDTAGSYLLFSLHFSFDIYSFLSFEFDLKSQNKGLDRYSSAQDMFSDLLDSFDFFGNGRYTTQFVMNSLSASMIHHMDDWDLVGRYTGNMVYENNRYAWRPVVSIYLKWKAIPEINIDRELEL